MKDTTSPDDKTVLHPDPVPLALRKDLLAALAIAERSLEEVKQDIADGIKIDPASVTSLERTIAGYKDLLDGKRGGKA